MRAYLVTFFKDLVSSNGHRFECPQCTIQILHAKSCERAIAAAQRRFERVTRSRTWKLHADRCEIELADASLARSAVQIDRSEASIVAGR